MISIGICVLHLHSSVLFKVLRMDNKFITLLPYRASEQVWDRDNILSIPATSIDRLTETQCPREGGN